MPTVRLKRRVPLDVEGFPTDAERSVKGALRLVPGVPAHVTEDEVAHMTAIGTPVIVTQDPPPRPAPVQTKKPKAKTISTGKPKKKAKNA